MSRAADSERLNPVHLP